ncbi:SRPBCC domain-containing protein [Phenylobacterium sp.]|jgi:uncharacterized protein YndB with AHSA1/START domain|uniref:SRPBCC family protein n=1 Tax=Phenylobacterium sp. TaxID=1871053 RepID=UPI002E334CED|nr:SRPBCC domain-containing protein [Phenylobacterium sp.]HEX2561837.1 SRPBCC domain-containing protein [Phenylobacterium sp.]
MRTIIAAAALLAASPASAEVVERSDGGFRTQHTAQVSAPPERVYQVIGEIGRWWDPAHTYSGKAENLSLELRPGGCFCEKVGAGGVQHGVVVMALPGQVLRLDAPLGPLQEEGVSAAFTLTVKPAGGGSEVVQTLHVGGARPKMAAAMSGPVDQVLGAALARLKRYAETGKPD